MLCPARLPWRRCDVDDGCRIRVWCDPGGDRDVLRQAEVSQAAAGVHNNENSHPQRQVWQPLSWILMRRSSPTHVLLDIRGRVCVLGLREASQNTHDGLREQEAEITCVGGWVCGFDGGGTTCQTGSIFFCRDSWASTADSKSTAVIHCNHISVSPGHTNRKGGRRGDSGSETRGGSQTNEGGEKGKELKGEEMMEKCIGISIIPYISENEANAVLCGSYE